MSAQKKPSVRAIVIIVVCVLAAALILYLALSSGRSGKGLDSFTQCINQKGAALYGAYWCSHCQSQKQLFGTSLQYLPYVECSTSDGKGQLPICAEKNITGYPTWIFGDGTRIAGEMSLELLSEKTGCPLPG